jgi:hypothetical protein
MTPESTIPISVELSQSLAALTTAKGLSGFERRLGSQLGKLAKDLGLSGAPTVKVQSGDSNRAVRVRVHGKLQPFDPNLLKTIWILVAPPLSRNAVTAPVDKPGFPDGWLTAFVANLAGSKADLGIVFEFLSRAVIEIISERPSCLVGPNQISTYMTEAQLDASPPETIVTLLKSLLDLGVSVNNHEVVRQAITLGQGIHRSTADIAESIFTQIRSDSIEIHVHPDYLNNCIKTKPVVTEDRTRALNSVKKFFGNVLNTLAPQVNASDSFAVYSEQVDTSVQLMFRDVERELFNRLGFQLPELKWIASAQVPDGFLSIKINDRLSPPVLGLQPGELLVHTSLDQLAPLNVQRRPAPLVPADYAIVAEADGNKIHQAGFAQSDISSLIPLVLKDEVIRRAARLVGVEDAEYQLAQLKLAFPSLVRTATACFSLGNFTRVLRTLVAEGISIRNGRAILEGMLKFETITVPTGDFIVFDDRLELSEIKPPDVSTWRNLSAFVRTTLKHFIGSTFGQYQNGMNVFTVDPDVQSRAELAAATDDAIDHDSWLSEAQQEALRDSAWGLIPDGRAGNPILTTTNARAPIHDLLRAEIPDIAVISYYELAPDMQLQPNGVLDYEVPAPATEV